MHWRDQLNQIWSAHGRDWHAREARRELARALACLADVSSLVHPAGRLGDRARLLIVQLASLCTPADPQEFYAEFGKFRSR